MSDSGLESLEPSLRQILDRIPADPGVYLMKDKKGKVIYIGKARSLRARVRSYFTRGSSDYRAFVALLGRLLGDIETVVVNNEKEALLLENNLIKQHQPRFNVKLIDDKNYLVLRLDPRARYPRLEVTRRIGSDGARYFGPYHTATSCRQTLHVVNRHFKLRTCSDQVLASRRRPCLQYQIKRCDAPCVFAVPEEEYAEQVRDVALFLEGKDQELVERLRTRMKEAAGRLEFEVAAAVRDQIGSLEKTLTEQQVVSDDLRDQDVFGYHREGSSIEIAVLHVRMGKLLGRRTFHFSGQEFPDDETISSFVSLYYDLGSYIPDEVLLPIDIEDADTKAEWLRERRAGSASKGRTRAVAVLHPRRGPRSKLLELAQKNAQAAWSSRRDQTEDAAAALASIRQRLSLKRLPRRIECYDVSHISGTSTVASMVVFIDGEPAKAEYRRFKVRSVENDDFAALYEVLSRRFRRGQGKAAAGDAARWTLPDLIVIDGGKGQLGAALAALRDAGADLGPEGIDVVGLAKERAAEPPPEAEAKGGARPRRWRRGRGNSEGDQRPDRVFLPRIKDAIPLRPNSAELHVLARIRDEAHRFAITYHRSLRNRRTLRSSLADIAGVGEKRQRELLRRFGSLRRVREASLQELLAVPGMTEPSAAAVRAFFADEVDAAARPRLPRQRDQEEALASLSVAPGPAAGEPEDDDLEDAAAAELAELAGPDLEGIDEPVEAALGGATSNADAPPTAGRRRQDR